MARTQAEKLWLGGTGAVALLLVVIGYFFLINPQRAQTADVEDQVSSAQLQGTTLQSRITSLTSQTKKLAAYQRALAQARQALPSSDDLNATPQLLRSLQQIGRLTSTSVSSLTVGAPAAVEAAVAATDPAAAPASSSESSAAPGVPPAAPAPTLYSVAITATVAGSSSHLDAFLAKLQHDQPRAVLISAVTIGSQSQGGPGGGSGGTLNLTMTAFVRPGAAAAAPASPVGAAPTTASTP